MSKKQKRRVSKGARPALNTPVAATNQPASRSWTPQHGFAATEFNPDYSAVKKDLKRIGILAGTFFVVLLVLSYFLR